MRNSLSIACHLRNHQELRIQVRAAGRSSSILQETKVAVNIEKMGVEAQVST